MSSNPLCSPLATASPAEREAQQLARLRPMMAQLLQSNPFYQAKLAEAGIASLEGLTSLASLCELPFTTKEEIVADQMGHPPFGSNLTFPLEQYSKVHQTSGTMGLPLRWLDTADSWAWWGECWKQVFRAAGIGAGDRIFFAFSFGPFIGFWSGWEGAEQVGALAISGGSYASLQRLHLLLELQATVLVGTPSYLLHLAEMARREGLDLRQGHLRALVVAGEPGGSIPNTRAQLESVWGAKVYDHAGSTEVGAFAFSCEFQQLHLNEAEFIAEVLLSDGDEPAEQGELVLTNLGRVGSPLLRYRTGDLVHLVRATCRCGCAYARLAGGILGRADDMIIVRGINVFPSAIENIVREHTGLGEFLIEVSRRDEIDTLRLLLEMDEDSSARLAFDISRTIGAQLMLNVSVIPVTPGSLPRWETKARRVRDLRE